MKKITIVNVFDKTSDTSLNKPRQFWNMGRKEAAVGYLLMVPAFLFLIVIIGYPLIRGIWLSMTDLNLENGMNVAAKFIGLKNFFELAQDPNLPIYLRNQLVWVIGVTTLPILTGMIFAILLNQDISLRGLFRGAVLITWSMPLVVRAIAWRWIFNGDWGVVNAIFLRFDLIKEPINWLIDKNTLWPTILFTANWGWFPFNYVVILAALQGISKDLYEAAEVDGANEWISFWQITLPLLAPVLSTLLILGAIWSMNDFTGIWVLTQGGPGIDSTTIAPLVYRTTMQFFKIGYGAAIAVSLMVVSLFFTFFYIRRVRFEQ